MENTTQHHTEKNTGMAVVAYLLFFVPLLTEQKNDPFVKFHVKQGFVLFLAALISNIPVFIIPFLFFITILLQLFVVILAIIGILNALHGKKEPLPFIGQYADKFSF